MRACRVSGPPFESDDPAAARHHPPVLGADRRAAAGRYDERPLGHVAQGLLRLPQPEAGLAFALEPSGMDMPARSAITWSRSKTFQPSSAPTSLATVVLPVPLNPTR